MKKQIVLCAEGRMKLKNGVDIMEYFHCDSFYQDIFPEILKELKMI
jgi:hypothetical protein